MQQQHMQSLIRYQTQAVWNCAKLVFTCIAAGGAALIAGVSFAGGSNCVHGCSGELALQSTDARARGMLGRIHCLAAPVAISSKLRLP